MEKLLQQCESFFFYALLLFLPTQLGRHYWPDFSLVSGVRIDYLSPTLYFTDCIIGLLFVFWFQNNFKQVKLKQVKIFVVVVGYLLFTVILSQNVLSGLYHLIKFLEFSFVGYYVAKKIRDLATLQLTTVVLSVSALFESFLAIIQFFIQGSVGSLFYFFGERTFTASTPGIANASVNGQLFLRPYGTLPHPNVLAGFLLIVMVLAFWMFGKTKENWQKSLYCACLLVGTCTLFLTMSRIAMLLWIIFLFGAFIRAKVEKKNKYLLGVGFILLLGSLLLTPVGNRFFATRLTEESVVQREALIAGSLTLIEKHPLVGVGFGNFLPALVTVQKPLSLGLYIQPVHNIFLLVLSETGIIGFGIFIMFLGKTYKYLLSRKATHRTFFVVLTTLLVLGLFDHYLLTLQQGQIMFALVLGLSWTFLDNRAEKNHRNR